MVDQAQESVSVPAASNALAQGLKKLVLAVVANHKALAGSPLAEVSADVTAAVASLAPALALVGALDDEAKADPFGMAEAFVIAGLDVAKGLYKPAAPAPVALAAMDAEDPAVEA